MNNTKIDKSIITRLIFGYTIFFGFFSAGVIGAYMFEGHWIGTFGRLSVDWGTIMMFIFHLFLGRRMKIKQDQLNRQNNEINEVN